MNVKRIVVHQLVKEVNDRRDPIVDLSSKNLEIDNTAIELVRKLNYAYSNTSYKNAIFSSDHKEHFPQAFNQYNKEENDDNFHGFTCESLKKLKQNLIKVPAAKGGYFVFADYEDGRHHYFGIFLIRNTRGLFLDKGAKEAVYKINSVTHLDLDKLAMACRINKIKYSLKDGSKYLSFIKNNQSDISTYFIKWIAAQAIESNKEYTDSLYKLCTHLPLPVNDKGEKYTLDFFRQKIKDYVVAQPNREINLHNMSAHFYNGDKELIINTANEQNLIIDSEFRADSKMLQKFTRIDISQDGITMRFSRGQFERKKIRFSPDNENQVIIESKAFAEALRNEIREYNNESL